jgi:hypothetical protein
MKGKKNMVPSFFKKHITTLTTLEELQEMLCHIETDRKNIENNRKVLPQLMEISEEEFVNTRTLLVDQMEEIVKSRIAELKPE